MSSNLVPHYRFDHPENVFDAFQDEPIAAFPAPETPKKMDVLIESPLKNSIIFESMIGTETLSEPFEFKIRVYSKDPQIDFKKLLGKVLTIKVQGRTTKKSTKLFSGVVVSMQSLNSFLVDSKAKKYIAYYAITLRPQFWLLTLSKQSCIYIKKSPIEIIEKILKKSKVTFQNKASSLGKTVREYCVQYNESDFDFISRLLEEEGIFYYFEYSASGEKMILAGENKAAKELSAVSMNVVRTDVTNIITLFNAQEQVAAKEFLAIDYDYMKPEKLLKTKKKEKNLGGTVYEYPGKYDTDQVAEKLGKTRMEEMSWPQSLAFGRSTALDFSAGSSFKLEKHTRQALNKKYLIYKISHHVLQRPEESKNPSKPFQPLHSNHFTALPMTVPFTPLRQTPKPKIYGSQTAVVVGPSGKEIFIDKEGRVLVQFHWDTEGKKDGKTSAPVRFMQGWAGEGFGVVVVPRIGMEVVVSFTDGDPDRPLIIGCVYNGKNIMPKEVITEPRITMFKTKTSPEDGKKAHVMSFDDTKEKEKITFNTTKDFELSSEAKENLFLIQQKGEKTTNKLDIKEGLLSTLIQKGEKKTEINEGNYSITLKKGSLQITLEDGDNVITLKKGNYVLKVSDGTMTVTVEKDIKIESKANISMKAAKDIELKADGEIKITAGKNITEKATMDILRDAKAISDKAKTDIKLDATNISEKAKVACKREGLNIEDAATMDCKRGALNIKDEAKMQAVFAGTVSATLDGKVMAEVKGGATAALKGAMTMIG